ncbi:MAG: stage II sporulation protein P [Clostridiales bacterium]|nr:stage II sporulation protein P [Clostridiales bacterium]
MARKFRTSHGGGEARRMGRKGQGRRLRRLTALAAAAGSVWLIVHPGAVTDAGTALVQAFRSSDLLSRAVSAELGADRSEDLSPEDAVLEALPQTVQEAQPAEAGSPVSGEEEPEALPEAEETEPVEDTEPVEEAVSVSGLLEAPLEEETEEAPEEVSESITPADASLLELTNRTDGIEVALSDYLERELTLTVSREGPQILIMHTHATEAYTIADGDEYVASDTARTTDENYNMIRVGEEMKAVFEEMGLSVVHDTTLYDYPSYTGSYARSLEGIKSYLEQYPTISIVLDVHRDALIADDGTVYKLTDTVDGETVAQVMLVVGTDDGGLTHPNWEENLTLATHIQARLLGIDAGFPRAINLRSQRFNQHMTVGSLLVEVGTSGNALREALAGARLFARAAGELYLACMESS